MDQNSSDYYKKSDALHAPQTSLIFILISSEGFFFKICYLS